MLLKFLRKIVRWIPEEFDVDAIWANCFASVHQFETALDLIDQVLWCKLLSVWGNFWSPRTKLVGVQLLLFDLFLDHRTHGVVLGNDVVYLSIFATVDPRDRGLDFESSHKVRRVLEVA